MRKGRPRSSWPHRCPSRRKPGRRGPPGERNPLSSGDRCSKRFPSLMVPSWVSEPTGSASPRRTSSTPAMKVVLTAPPIPGMRTPSLPLGRRDLLPLFQVLGFQDKPSIQFYGIEEIPVDQLQIPSISSAPFSRSSKARFISKPARIAAQLPSARDNPVAWYENGNRVSAACPANGPRSPGALRLLLRFGCRTWTLQKQWSRSPSRLYGQRGSLFLNPSELWEAGPGL